MSGPQVPLAGGTAEPPSRVYDVALLDLDGVVYVGPEAVPGVPEALAAARTAGMRLGFVTNNASRTPEEVAGHLTELAVPASAADVITSFTRLIAVNPTDDYAHFGLGLAASRAGKLRLAAEHLALAAAMRPDLHHYAQALRGVRARRAAGPS